MKNEELENQPKEQPYHHEGEFDPELGKKIELRGHKWKQQGSYIVCSSCPFKHASFVGIKVLLVGYTDEGYPKFVRRA